MSNDPPANPWPFVTCLVVLAVSAAGLILLIPASLRDGDGDVPAWLIVTLAALMFAAGAAARRLRPTSR